MHAETEHLFQNAMISLYCIQSNQLLIWLMSLKKNVTMKTDSIIQERERNPHQ